MLLSSVPLVVIPLTEFLAVSPVGTGLFLFLQIFIFFPAIASFFAIIISPFFLLVRSKRRIAGKIILGASLFILTCFFGLKIGHAIRMDAFHRLALRSASLVEAIIRYNEDHGNPPNTLEDLVPAYLPKVPETDIMAYPKYRYFSGKDAAKYEGNPWVLVVFTPGGGINFDQFMYFPLQNYPKTGYGGWLRPIHDWAYVHE